MPAPRCGPERSAWRKDGAAVRAEGERKPDAFRKPSNARFHSDRADVPSLRKGCAAGLRGRACRRIEATTFRHIWRNDTQSIVLPCLGPGPAGFSSRIIFMPIKKIALRFRMHNEQIPFPERKNHTFFICKIRIDCLNNRFKRP